MAVCSTVGRAASGCWRWGRRTLNMADATNLFYKKNALHMKSPSASLTRLFFFFHNSTMFPDVFLETSYFTRVFCLSFKYMFVEEMDWGMHQRHGIRTYTLCQIYMRISASPRWWYYQTRRETFVENVTTLICI